MEATGKLDAEGVSNSRLTMNFRGDSELLVRLVVRQLSPAQYEQLGQQVAANMGYVGTVSRVELSRPEDTREPMRMSFDYQRSKAGDWANYKTIPQLMPLSFPRIDEKDPPVQSLELGVLRVEVSKAAMTLPEGWKAEMPQAIHARSEWATEDLTYRFEKGVMYAERRVEILKERVPVADFKVYDKFAEKAADEQYVQLRPLEAVGRNGGAAEKTQAKGAVQPGVPAAAPVAGPAGGDAKPAELLEQASQALQRHDVETAQRIADRLKAVDAEEPGLWALNGSIAMARGEMTEAAADYDKELKLHPAWVSVYPYLFGAQMALKQRAEAMKTAERWAVGAPGDARPLGVLATMQMEDGNIEEAARSAERGLARAKDDAVLADSMRVVLAKAEMKLGHQEKARVLLVDFLNKTEDPCKINNVAYDLINAGLELPLCETKVKTALRLMEEQSRDWTLDQAVPQLRAGTAMLQATWDTLGWAYFKEGKVELAERYIKAAWAGAAECGGRAASGGDSGGAGQQGASRGDVSAGGGECARV